MTPRYSTFSIKTKKSKFKSTDFFWYLFFHVFEVDSAKTRENDGYMMQLSEKRLVLRPIWQKCSTIHLQSREILAGLTVACPHLFAWQNLKTVHFPPLEPSNTWKKKVPKKICRLKFRFLCLDRKS